MPVVVQKAGRDGLVIGLYFVLIAVAESVTVLLDPIFGILFHSVLLFALVVHAAVVEDTVIRHLLLPLTLAPLTRILSLSMPLTVLPQVYWYPLIYLPLAVAAVVVMRQIGLSRHEVGINANKPLWQLLIIPVGAVLGLVEFLILRPAPLLSHLTAEGAIFSSLVLIGTTGVVEELIFRGVLQRVMKDRFGWVGIILISLLFAVLHLGFLSALDFVFVFAVAMLFAWLVNRTGSIVGVSLAHGLTNTLLYVILPHLQA